MTVQIREYLYIDGEEQPMCAQPLNDYFALGGRKPAFVVNCSALWRGYMGTWEIRAGRLYLVHITATLEDGTTATLETFFPGYPERVFAHWYCGTLRIPQGELLDYVHGGYASAYERDRLIDVDHGLVVRTRIRHNRLNETNGEENS